MTLWRSEYSGWRMKRCIAAACAGLALFAGGAAADEAASLDITSPGSNSSERIVIMQPADESTVFDNNGHVAVMLKMRQALAPEERVELYLDGHQVPSSGAPDRYAVEHVERGSHQLQARIVDRSGAAIAVSKPVTFFLWQASRNFPSRR